ncbi:MAG: UDP-N-acetylmuramoyl-L-alanine--D-glutamate ligase [Chloroflexota bacterium]|nr:UDP-N-acetylmuramoyl-L-alanine--D-glutamate ligase [Chloroflexota bacterium]
MDDLRGKRILVLGLGVHGGGVGVARFAVGQGAEVCVTDGQDAAALAGSLAALEGLPIRYTLGRHEEADFAWADLIVRNPAVPRESPWLALAAQLGTPVVMELGLFAALCPGPIIGITGTKGKTTVATWTWEMVRRAYPDAVLAGNLRVSALDQLPRIGPETRVVLEMSSWQLEGTDAQGWSPPLAAVTNLSPDHLNRYRDMDDYAEAKFAIARHQHAGDTAVFNGDDAYGQAFAARAPGRVVWFGHHAPDAAGPGPGVYVEGADLVWYADNGARRVLLATADLAVPGGHNRLNACCAAQLALLAGVPLDAVQAALRSFRGVADRLEWVATVNGVSFYNDTTATTPAAVEVALAALAEPLVLIAGGADKRSEFGALAPVIAARCRAVVLLEGSATPALYDALIAAGANVLGRDNQFARAVRFAYSFAQPGDAVLLSPGCASFGMFANEFDRGAQFRAIVAEIAAAADAAQEASA